MSPESKRFSQLFEYTSYNVKLKLARWTPYCKTVDFKVGVNLKLACRQPYYKMVDFKVKFNLELARW